MNLFCLMVLLQFLTLKILFNLSTKNKVVLVHCNLVNNTYQEASKVLFTFVPNKQFGQLITISPHLLTMLKTTNAEFQSIQLWFTDENNRPLKIEDSVNITLIIG